MLKERTVSFVMTAERLLTVDVVDPLARVQRLLRDHPIHHIPVLEKGKLVGIISTSDLLRIGLGVQEHGLPDASSDANGDDGRTAGEVMERALVTLRPRDSLLKAAKLLIQESFSSLPVVDELGELVGILTTRDMLRYMIENEMDPGQDSVDE